MTESIDIYNNLIKSDSSDLPSHFVAAAVQIDHTSGVAIHAGIIINKDDRRFLFHYTGSKVELVDVPNNEWYFHKDLIIISNKLTSSFLAHCTLVKKNAKPEYGFLFAGYYNTKGKYCSPEGVPEYTTCVGFCLNVLSIFTEEDEYLSLNDWDSTSMNESYKDFTLKNIARLYPDIKESNLNPYLKRILPDEYLASAFDTNPPVKKAFIDNIIEDVREALFKKSTK